MKIQQGDAASYSGKRAAKLRSWAPKFSRDPLVLPCLIVLRIFNQKGVGRPKAPTELLTDKHLQVQLVYDVALAVHSLWQRSFEELGARLSDEWSVERCRILKSYGHVEAVEALNKENILESEAAVRRECFELFRASSHDERLIREAERTVFKAEEVFRNQQQAVIRSLQKRAVKSLLKTERSRFERSTIRPALDSQELFELTPEAIRNESVCLRSLAELDACWGAIFCSKIGSSTRRGRWSLPSYIFRLWMPLFEYHLAASSDQDKATSLEDAFREWVENFGFTHGIPIGTALDDVVAACVKQDALLDEEMKKLIGLTFADFRTSFRGTYQTQLEALLGIEPLPLAFPPD